MSRPNVFVGPASQRLDCSNIQVLVIFYTWIDYTLFTAFPLVCGEYVIAIHIVTLDETPVLPSSLFSPMHVGDRETSSSRPTNQVGGPIGTSREVPHPFRHKQRESRPNIWHCRSVDLAGVVGPCIEINANSFTIPFY
jgi:hypothetical protein